jgi:hypothetical protein
MLGWEFINKYKIGICIGLIILSLMFIMFGHCYKEQVQQVLKQELCKFPECSIDYWSISHFMLFGLFGFLIPDYPVSFFTIGTGFELIEDYLSSDSTTLYVDCSNPCGKDTMCNKDNSNRKIWCNGIQDGYWYSNATDSFVNLLGYVIGSAVRTTFFAESLTK